MTKETSVLLVDPVAKTVTDGGRADGYAGIKAIFEERFPAARLEHNTLCRVEDGLIHVATWVDCEQYRMAPRWSYVRPGRVFYGFTVISAYDMRTGEPVDCPVSAAEFDCDVLWPGAENSTRRARRAPRR